MALEDTLAGSCQQCCPLRVTGRSVDRRDAGETLGDATWLAHRAEHREALYEQGSGVGRVTLEQ